MEAWIEIAQASGDGWTITVASFMEAWIEIKKKENVLYGKDVASFMEAWIEILMDKFGISSDESPPSWRRGLKLLKERRNLSS